MFTGIIEGLGRIAENALAGGDRRMLIAVPTGFLDGAQLGDSIAVNGVCLTAVAFRDGGFVADLSAETLGATTAAGWAVDRVVNLERALTPNKPLGGHLVSGHVDGVGHLRDKRDDARSWRLEFEAPAALARYIARKGSICIDGISLTVNEVSGRRFGVNIVPHTMTHTALGQLTVGDAVNLEVDLVARYLERLLTARDET
ncbi:MAG: riboflavin synthase [Nevskiaceae bacterium]|nr:MAG: riboflavin synthase [Nevskiaceae bacterium]